MKKVWWIPIAATVVATAAILASPTIREEIGWRWASYSDRLESYSGYIVAWPNGRHSENARVLLEEKAWESATAQNTLASYDLYLKNLPGGKHVKDALIKKEDCTWAQTTSTNTVSGYRDYLGRNPKGRYSEHAKAKLEALLRDDSPFQTAERQGTREAMEQFLTQFPGHIREKDARSAIKNLEGRNITELIADKKIEVKAGGSGIQGVSLSIHRLVNSPIKVIIPVGTFFVAGKGSVQNMVTRQENNVILLNDSWYHLNISAACANRPRAIPQGGDSFSVQLSPQSKDLERLMPELLKARATFAVEQAAIWIVTDNANYSELGTLVSRSQFQVTGSRVINEIDVARAMKICDSAGINIIRKAIWRDRYLVMGGVQDETLKSWIREKSDGEEAIKAAAEGNLSAIKRFIANGIDVNVKDNDGWTGLMSASQYGRREVVELLLARGANINAKDEWGRTPLHLASGNGHKDVAELLLTNQANVNAKANDGETPLHLAALNGHEDVSELLLAKGADVNSKRNDGATALMLAAKNNHKKIKDLLIKAGAK